MLYRVLGDLEISTTGDDLVELPSGRARAVLATFLLRPNRTLPAEELISAGWGEHGVNQAQLHKAVSTLRKVCGDALKTHPRYGYELVVPDDDLDMLSFRRLVRQADARRDGSAEEVAALRAALALWRTGRPLSNMQVDALSGEIEALRRQRKRAATRLFDLEVQRGAHTEVLEELTGFAAEYPADANLCRLLLLALYRDGHAADIIPAFDRYEQASEAPDRSLRHLAFRLVSTGEAPGLTVPRQLPARPPYLLGRDGLLAEILWLLRRPKLPVLAISGPGGMGKTALALGAAHDAAETYPDGQLWADLRGTREQPADPAEVLAEFLRALGVPAVPESRAERASLFRSTMAGRQVLVLLDDAADGAQVRDLLPGGGKCLTLITSRRRLPDLGAPTHHVPPLGAFDEATAEQLFARIATDHHVSLAGSGTRSARWSGSAAGCRSPSGWPRCCGWRRSIDPPASCCSVSKNKERRDLRTARKAWPAPSAPG
ncbi:AfsR/SARP family transcriptional regulator [Paractinoplanes durhamensis]|uniref:AfsR/SARP family transcriptional regulator n=1 Tax=Paractinoplanes durhamensis TaxID=113563 RepID=UPI00363AC3F0